MFDISEYCLQEGNGSPAESRERIEEELVSDIDGLMHVSGGGLYLSDRYKNGGISIDLVYPTFSHQLLYSYLMSPDRARFMLSLYPYRSDLSRVSKIIMRPRYIEAGDIELAALYVKETRALVFYLTSPGCDSGSIDDNPKFVSASLDRITGSKIIGDSIEKNKKDKGGVPLLWNIISVVDTEGDGEMEKFFLKRQGIDGRDYTALSDLSHHYRRLGY